MNGCPSKKYKRLPLLSQLVVMNLDLLLLMKLMVSLGEQLEFNLKTEKSGAYLISVT